MATKRDGGWCLSSGQIPKEDESASLHFIATKDFGDGEEMEMTLHGHGELENWLDHVESLEPGQSVTIAAISMICQNCQRRAKAGVTFMCHMPDWAGPTGG